MKSIPFSDVRAYYYSHQPDGHWFDTDALRFFQSKLPSVAYETSDGVLFLTSEVNPSGVKRFSVRRQTVSGDIKTVGEFHSYATASLARTAIKAVDITQ